MKAAIGDYLYTQYGYYEVTQVSADGHPVVSKHDEARNSYAVSCCRGRYYVDGILDSYPVIGVLTDVEYFVAKPVSRSAVPLDVWNKFYHDHEVEIATGRVQVLDMSDAQANEVAAAAAKTDGIIFHLWPKGAKAPDGSVGHPTSVGHKPRTE